VFFSAVFALPVGRLPSYLGIVPHGSLLDVPNAALGILYYLWVLLFIDSTRFFQRYLNPVVASLAEASSIILAYQLTFVVKELCVLCVTAQVINSVLFYRIAVKPLLLSTTTRKNAVKQKYA
jgi:uncharacterized membrane protein